MIFPELLGANPTKTESSEAIEDTASVNKEYGEDFDVRELMRAAKDPLTGTLRDLRIDDRDLKVAKNYYDWCFNVSGSENRPWARQLWVMLKFFNELCPKCNTKSMFSDITTIDKEMDPEELGDKLIILENGVCPNCHGRKSQMVNTKDMALYDELVLVWGQRSGKSTTGVSGASYHLHRFLKFPMFGTLTTSMSTATPLSASFVSLNFGKAFTTLWQPLKSLISSTPWYLELFKILDYYGNQYGEELYARRKEFLQFNHKNLILRPCSPSWDSLRGDTRWLAMIDELGLFRLPGEDADDEEGEDDSQRANADEAHKSLDNSLLTIRTASEDLLYKGMDAVPTGILLGVSSPTSLRDKVMRLLKECSTDIGSQHMLGSQLPTWEVNPSIRRTSRSIVNAYAKNASKAERDFGANPVSSASSYIEASSVLPMFGKYVSTHKLTPVHGPNGDLWAIAKKVRTPTAPTLMIIDAGYTNNSFAIITLSYDNGSVKTECVCELMPRDGLRINFNKLYLNAIKPIANDNFSVIMAADQWQGIDTLSRFTADNLYKKAKSKRYSLKRKNFDAVRSLMEDQMFLQPKPEMAIDEIVQNPDIVTNYRTFFADKPVAHLAHQFVTIRDIGPTQCPTKGIGWTDDVARAWFLGAYLIQDEKVQKILSQAAAFMPKQNSGHGTIGIYRTRY